MWENASGDPAAITCRSLARSDYNPNAIYNDIGNFYAYPNPGE